MHIIEARGVTKDFGDGEACVHALRGIDLQVSPGEMLALMGASGSGKSTLLHILGGVEVPSAGQVLLEGTDLATLSDDERTLIRRQRLGFIFQQFNLLPTLSAEENVSLPLELDGKSRKEAHARAIEALERVGVAHRRSHIPSTMSGGEQQRVAIARALVTQPTLLLADEPTGNLDSTNGRQVMGLLKRLVESEHHTIIMVTHDPDIAAQADRVVCVRDGLLDHDVDPTKFTKSGQYVKGSAS
jgi:putative ABC transport system ATP-binding protein